MSGTENEMSSVLRNARAFDDKKKVEVTVNWKQFGDVEAPVEKTATEPPTTVVLPPREAELVIETVAHRAVLDRMSLHLAKTRIAELEQRVAMRTHLLKQAHEERDLLKQTSEAAIGHLTKIVGKVGADISVEVVAAAAVGVHANAINLKAAAARLSKPKKRRA